MSDEIRIFLARSKLRLKVLRKLNQKPQIAIFLADEMNKNRVTISRIFIALSNKGLARCKNPTDPNFRYYEITPLGKKVLEEL